MRHPSAGGAFGRTFGSTNATAHATASALTPVDAGLCVCRNLTHVVVLFDDLVGQCPHWVERGSGLRVRDGRRSGVTTCEQETHRRPARSGRTRGHHRDRRRSRSGRSRTSADAHVRTARAACLREGPTTGHAACFAKVLVNKKGAVPMATSPLAIGAVAGPTPRRLQPERPSGAGRTVAIVDAYGYPNLERDLGIYRQLLRHPGLHPGERMPEDHRPERRLPACRGPTWAGHRSRRSTWMPCPPPAPTARS